ncbi:MAG: hypothetical protein HY962_03060 [Ignavibacteriae bacterium]|nr:hypothetical protein [Ignavibacteriota bacterium]
MKRLVTLSIVLPILLLSACDEGHGPDYDVVPPLPPVGITSTSLDRAVELRWIENQEGDIAGYNVYVSSSYRGRYDLIGNTRTASFVDLDAVNGVTYYYAVAAYDINGNESDLSRDVVYDTPRPEGRNVVMTDRFRDPGRGGYDFSDYRIVHYDTDNTDLYLEIDTKNVPYFVVWDDGEIQDMGYTRNIDEISAAPEAGWNPTKDAAIVRGHTYVVKTFDNHFAKVRVVDVGATAITFDWAYQTATGNPELFHRGKGSLSKRARGSASARAGH